jgi:hypothetical protein
MSFVGRSRPRSQRDRERDIRMTRSEGARRALRANQATDLRGHASSSGRPSERDQLSFPSRSSVVRFAERIRNLSRSGT